MIESVKWADDEVARFQALRRAEARGELLEVERSELEALLAELDADEADALRPALARMRGQAAYWHEDDPPFTRLLHPGLDDLELHVRAGDDGLLVGLTSP